jgi:hypothetical protein
MKNQKTNEQLQADQKLMRQLKTAAGFHAYYFSLLPKHKNFKAAYQAADDKHFELFGDFRYTGYESFKASRYNRNKSKRKKK